MTINKIVLSLVVIAALAAVTATVIAPFFTADNGVVYGGF